MNEGVLDKFLSEKLSFSKFEKIIQNAKCEGYGCQYIYKVKITEKKHCILNIAENCV